MINKIKNKIAKQIRKIIVVYYRMMGIIIGKNVFISHKAKIDTTFRGSITIGDGCIITHGVIIISHDASIYRRSIYQKGIERGHVKLKNRAYIGSGAIILMNVTIGENSIVGAGSVVTKDVPPNVIVAGNPAKIIKSI